MADSKPDNGDQITIAAQPDAVWAVLAAFGRISEWASNVDHSCLVTQTATGVNAVRRVQVGRNALLERVVEWEPGHQLSYVLEGLPPVVKSVINTWQLEPVGESTRVTLSTKIGPAGPRPPQQVAAKVFGRVLAKASKQLLDGLKAHVEELER